jgi:Mg2+-importing ATPase
MKKKLLFLKNNPQEILHREKVNERLRFAAAHDVNTVLKYLGTTGKGLPSGMVEQARERYGDNVVTHGQKESLFTRICKAFINPFTAILFVLAAVSAFTSPNTWGWRKINFSQRWSHTSFMSKSPFSEPIFA